MPDEATTALQDWLTAHGYPPISGADDGTVPESESTPTEPTDSAQEPASDAAPEENVDYEKRYNDLRPEFDRRGTQLQEAEPALQLYKALQSPETRDDVFRYIAEQFGYQVAQDALQEAEDGEPEEQFQDPRVDELAAQVEQDRFERYLDDLEGYIDHTIDDLAKEANVTLSDDERNLIFATVEIEDDGSPKVEDAFKRIASLRDLHIDEYRKQKQDKPAPPAPSRSPGEEQAISTDGKARRAAALEVANAAFARSS